VQSKTLGTRLTLSSALEAKILAWYGQGPSFGVIWPPY